MHILNTCTQDFTLYRNIGFHKGALPELYGVQAKLDGEERVRRRKVERPRGFWSNKWKKGGRDLKLVRAVWIVLDVYVDMKTGKRSFAWNGQNCRAISA
jgi:hypothetical protein